MAFSAEMRQSLRFNFAVNVADGGFFGLGLGFASYVTVIPLFVASLTDSSVIIGLIASLHTIGWQLPQLLTANRVAGMTRYKPLVMFMTLHERWPFFGLMVVALLIGTIPTWLALTLTLIFVSVQSLGGGFAATSWQSMIAKIIPSKLHGTFYGVQSAAANLLSSGGAVLAGVILQTMAYPSGFVVVFFIAGIAMFVSMAFLSATREPAVTNESMRRLSPREFAGRLRGMLRDDHGLRLFIVARMLLQVALVGLAFYSVYAVGVLGMSEANVGILTGVLLISQFVASPLLGWLGDRFSHRYALAVGGILAGASALLALLAPDAAWFYLVFALVGAAQSSSWTTVNALTVRFGAEHDRPYYIGLTNTLVAPITLIAPIIGGLLVDSVGHGAMFIMAIIAGLLTALIMIFLLREPTPQVLQPAGS